MVRQLPIPLKMKCNGALWSSVLVINPTPLDSFIIHYPRQWWSSSTSWTDGHNSWSWQSGHSSDAWPVEAEAHPMEEEQDAEVQRVQVLKDKFWDSEEASRMRCAQLTPFEKHQLTKHTWSDGAKAHVARVVAMFGEAKGPTKAARALLTVVLNSKRPEPGTLIDVRSPEFSLAKHLMLGQWKGLGYSTLTPGSEMLSCHCLPSTCFMLAGCKHLKGGPLTAERIFYLERLCGQCTTCLRCAGYLGLIK